MRKFTARTDRVKSVDIHPTEPWIMASLYNGSVWVWNYETQATVKTFEVSDLPIRTAKFVARKSWIIAGGDEMLLKVYNYNTFEKVAQFEAHTDYIRCIAIHPTQSLVLTCADDALIKLWDWDKNWKCAMTFEGHSHFVMQLAFNPKDANTFASASLDRTVKVWNVGSGVPNFTLAGHENGVNCVDYYHGGDKPYLISGGDDHAVKIWDYQNKTCVVTLEGHTQNVNVTAFHPELPIIITGSEDGSIKIWNSRTNKLEHSLNYGMERVWCLAYQKGTNNVAIGFEEGSVVVKLGREDPAVSMDNSGKIIWAKHNEILTANVKVAADDNVKDGERLLLSTKELGNCEIYPQSLVHSPNGRLIGGVMNSFVVVCGDGEYIIYTALAWRNKSFGSAVEFAWSPFGEYAIRETSTSIKLYDKQFKEKQATQQPNPRITYAVESIYSGALLGVRSPSGFLAFYDWETGSIVRRIETAPRSVFWNDVGDLVAIVCAEASYVLRFSREQWQAAVESGAPISEEGIESALTFEYDINEEVKSGCWVGDCFIYTNNANRLNYLVGGQSFSIAHFDVNMYLLGYIAKDNRVYLCDKDINVVSYQLPVTMIEYQTAILRGDLDTAQSVLPTVPQDQRSKVARFLESQGLQELALDVTTDLEHKFELAAQLRKLDVAYAIASEINTEAKWKQIGDAALQSWRFDIAEECMSKANDIEGLLMLYSSSGNADKMRELGARALEAGMNNIAFLCYNLLGDAHKCVEVLLSTERVPEAAFYAKTYAPSQVEGALEKWKALLEAAQKPRIAQSLDAVQQSERYPDFDQQLAAERAAADKQKNREPATNYARRSGVSSPERALSPADQQVAEGEPEYSPTNPNADSLL
ncbi:Coatomer subunit beta' [Sorochytrium milnesiophthora]